MIENPTVFVLGAGAHCSYGFPSGKNLKSEIIAAVNYSMHSKGEQSFDYLVRAGVAQSQETESRRCSAFMEALYRSGQPSIDAFLNANKHQLGFEIIGKAAIAQLLLAYEKTALQEWRNKEKHNDDWLTYLFERMLDGAHTPEEFSNRNYVSFITYNYDRFLEWWLHERIKNSFGLQDGAALNILRKIPIHHMYGSLGNYPEWFKHDNSSWISASCGIKTIFEAVHDPDAIASAKKLLEQARVICMLGFGYHWENISLIDLQSYLKEFKGRAASSRYDITNAEWSIIERLLPDSRIQSTNKDDQCLATLRNVEIF